MRISVPYLQVRSNTLYQYNQSEDVGKFCRVMQSRLYENMRECDTYTGVLKPGAKKRLIKAIEFLVMSTPNRTILNPVTQKDQPFKLSFITLTVSGKKNITGKEAHSQLLEPFLQWMRRTHKCNLYIWKAELQQRGQIHYHITSNVFIHWRELRTKWNSLQQKHGYLDGYYKKKGHYDPNSVDVHSVKKIRNISGYLIKEIAKGFQNTKSIGGKVWDCSLNIKASKYYTTLLAGDYTEKIDQLIKTKQIVQIPTATEHCRIYRTDFPAFNILNESDKQEYNKLMVDLVAKEITIPKVIKTQPPEDYYYSPIKKVNFKVQLNLFSSS